MYMFALETFKSEIMLEIIKNYGIDEPIGNHSSKRGANRSYENTTRHNTVMNISGNVWRLGGKFFYKQNTAEYYQLANSAEGLQILDTIAGSQQE